MKAIKGSLPLFLSLVALAKISPLPPLLATYTWATHTSLISFVACLSLLLALRGWRAQSVFSPLNSQFLVKGLAYGGILIKVC